MSKVLLEKRILDRVVIISIIIIIVYALVQFIWGLSTDRTGVFAELIVTLSVLILYGSYFLLLHFKVDFNTIKAVVYIIFHVSIVNAFFITNGFYGPVPADIICLIIAGVFLFQKRKSRIIVISNIILTILLLLFVQTNHDQIIGNIMIINPSLTISMAIISRFILGLNLTIVIWQEYKREKEHIELKNEKITGLNNQLKESNLELVNANRQLSDKIDQLKYAQDQLIQTEKMTSLGLLTAGVAHEVNNPLNFIKGGHYGLKKYFGRYGSEDLELTNALMNSIEEGFERTASIVKTLGQFTQSRLKKKKPVDLKVVIDDCLIILKNKIENKITIKLSSTPRPALLNGNSAQLHQLMINILINAIQAISGKGEIEICTEANEKEVLVNIMDNGIGMSETTLDKAFDPFFTTKTVGSGTGLGLSVAYNIVKEHNGRIELFSEENKGTEVRVYLPV